MKQFRKVNGKIIHPYIKSVKKALFHRKKLHTKINNKFVPPFALSLYPDTHDERDFTLNNKPELIKFSSKVLSSTTQIDYTNEMSPIKDQGNLGACVGFAAAAMKEWQERHEHETEVKVGKRDHRKNKEYNYSEAWIYWNCKEIDPWPNSEGTSIRYAMKILHQKGVPTEKAWPYSDLNIGEPKKWAGLISKWAMIGSYYRIKTVDEAKVALEQDGPFIMGIPCFYDFFFVGRDGIVPDPKPGEKYYGGHAVCLSGDTKIPLLNGETKTIKDLAENYNGDKFEVYSCTKEGEIVKGEAHSPRLTGKDRILLKITLDNGKTIKCTEDHLIMKRDGCFVKAKELKQKDSLMPLYRKDDYYGYENFWDNKCKKWIRTHRMVCPTENKMVVHHKNYNKKDNSSKNLIAMTWDDHTDYHSKNTILLNEYSKSKRGRLKSKEVMTKNWQNEGFKTKMLKINKQNGYNVSKKLKLKNKLGFQDMPKEQLKQIGHENGLKNYHKLNTPEVKAKVQQTLKAKRENDENYRGKMKQTSINNLSKYNADLKNGKVKITEKQKEARRNNILKVNKNKNITKTRALKTAYTRFYKDKYKCFEDYLQEKLHNHKIISIEKCGTENVYDITVDTYHNFAIDSGVFVHNCGVGFNDDKKLLKFKNSWSETWGQNGYGYISYNYFNNYSWDNWACKDISVTRNMLKGSTSI